MKHIILLTLTTCFAFSSIAQVTKNIPSSAYMVFSADLGRITKSMSVKEMDDYDFIQEMIREFSGSNQEDVSLKDLGLDFKGKIAIFSGGQEAYTYIGFTMDVKDKSSFLANEKIRKEFSNDLKSEGYSENERSIGYFKKKTFSRIEFEWEYDYFRNITDSIFDANKWERPYGYGYNYGYEKEEAVLTEEIAEEMVEQMEKMETMEIDSVETEATEETMEEKYERILDSVETAEKSRLRKEFYQQITDGKELLIENEDFKSTMEVVADASVYMDPDKINRFQAYTFSYNPLLRGIRQFSNNIWQSAHMYMTKDGMKVDWYTHGDEKVMKVTKAGLDRNFNSDLIKYVPNYSQGVAAYNFNMLGAYDAVKEAYMPVLDESEEPSYLLASAIWSTIDEIVDESAVADVYGANMILSYNGMKEMTLTKTTYDYDEETFEYTEREEKYQDLIPIMTWAVSTKKAYLLEKYMKAAMAYADEEIVKHDGYYEIKKGPMGGTPFYVAVKKATIIVTNDKSLVQDHLDGYDKGVDKETQKAIKETRFVYAHMDMEQMPDDMLALTTGKGDRDFIEAMKDKTGKMEVSLTEVTDDYQRVSASFKYDKNYKNGMFYLMDILDTLTASEDEEIRR